MVAPVFKLSVREPVRGQFDPQQVQASASFREILQTLLGKPSFWLMSFGAAASSMMGYGLFFWLPSYFVRSFDMQLLEASMFYGGIVLVGGIVGTWLGGMFADKFGQKNKSAYVLVPALAFVLTVPFYVLGILSPNLAITFFAMLIPTALGLAWLGPVLSAIQHVVPVNMRATAAAVFLFINNLVGIGLGTVALGIISDSLAAKFGDDSLRYAILSGTGFYVIAALLFFSCRKRLPKDWVA